jgi:uncharacterized membrane protein YphA (DoxX/SURF4 family)
MLASMFIAGGVDALRNAKPRTEMAEDVTTRMARKLPYLPDDPETLVKINAAVMVGAGSMLATGRLPRLSAALLAGSIIPTTMVGHRFWAETDAAKRAQQRTHFFKNLGLLGGVLLAAVDTEGQPGVAWRMRHATHHTAAGSRRAARTARREARLAAHSARAKLPG